MPSERVAIITGAAAGIGRAIADVLAEQGCAVVAADRVEPAATPPGSVFVRADVTDANAVAALFATARERFGRLDVLVNNAGVAGAPGWEEHQHPRPEDWRAAFRVNVLGTVGCIEAALPGLGPGGRIVNVASISGRQGRPMFRHYAATKAAVLQLTRAFAPRCAGIGAAINAVCPGIVWTPMWERVGRAFARTEPQYAGLPAEDVYARMAAARIPLRRGQTPRSIAAAAAFLASPAAAGLNGEILTVDGGIYPS